MARCAPRHKALATALIAASLLALAAAALVGRPSDKKAAPRDFPLSLWASATNDDYVGSETCAGCHAENAASFERSGHATFSNNPKAANGHRGCESCHGPGKTHIEHVSDGDATKFIFRPSSAKPAEVSSACLRCHSDVMTSNHWKRTEHARGNVSCLSCHYIHKDSEQDRPAVRAQKAARTIKSPIYVAARETNKLLRDSEANMCGACHQREAGEFRKSFHHPVPEGRVVCSDCHQLHPSRAGIKNAAGQTASNTGRQMCVKCHADKAGPFVYQHDPVAGDSGDGCTECHKPHGSTNPKLLSTLSRSLCNQCHTEKAATHYPGQTCWAGGCHAALHGSNTSQYLVGW